MSSIKPRQVLKIVGKSPGSTAKQITKLARAKGLECTRSEVNSALYTLLGRSEVVRAEPESGAAPTWYPAGEIVPNLAQPAPLEHQQSTPRSGRLRNLNLLALDEGLELVVGERALSANDPYIEVEMLDERVVVTVNTSHPAWVAVKSIGELEAPISTTIALVDALVLVKSQRSPQPLSGKAIIAVRDAYLRELTVKMHSDHF